MTTGFVAEPVSYTAICDFFSDYFWNAIEANHNRVWALCVSISLIMNGVFVSRGWVPVV